MGIPHNNLFSGGTNSRAALGLGNLNLGAPSMFGNVPPRPGAQGRVPGQVCQSSYSDFLGFPKVTSFIEAIGLTGTHILAC
jgi:hypothetical protein